MRWMNYFGEYQPLDGRVGFIFREAFRNRDDFYYKTHFSLKGDGIFFVLIDKQNPKNIYEIKTTKKTARPAQAAVKEKVKSDILKVFLEYVTKEKVFNEKLTYEKANVYKDGVELKVDSNYLVPNLESGIVVFMGDKEDLERYIREDYSPDDEAEEFIKEIKELEV